MRRLLVIAALSAIVLAKPKPESYKETEDFQYSRSSSDDGTKSGFYGAQRGNMGGNYERAHNMDGLAQHQMSGLVRQVDGELGEGAKTRTGSVYAAANSRGIYGSGHYDLSNLQGRNFAEGESLGNSRSMGHLSSHNSRYSGQSYSGMGSNAAMSSSHSQNARYNGYQSSRHADQEYIDNLQAVDTSQDLGRYESNNQADYNTKYHTQYGSRGRSEINQSSANLHSASGDASSQFHYITTPVRVVVRPGGRVAIPMTASTYSLSPNVILPENSGIPSDAEVIVGSTPTNKAKHYEASYSYRKQWEKHHSIPGDVSIVVPTENPFPKNSELYEDAQLLQSAKDQLQNAHVSHSGNTNNEQRAYSSSASSGSRFQAGYNSQHSHSGYESQQSHADVNSQHHTDLSSLHSQSGLTSQQIYSGLDEQQSHLGYNSRQSSASSAARANTYGRKAQTSRTAEDLTNAVGDIDSKPKSYHSSYSYHKSWERQGDPYVIKPVGPIYDGQASEKLTAASSNSAAYSSHQYGSHSRQAHQSYSDDCDEHGHVRVARSYNTDQELEQAQNQWEDLGQQTETKLQNLEDLGQQTETKFENLEDLGQQQQNKWDNLQDLGQQTQNQWDNLQQLGQETQQNWGNLQQLGQQTQSQWDNLQQLGQQTQGKWDNLEDFSQQTHTGDPEQQNLEDFSLVQKQDAVPNFEQQTNNQNEYLDILSQHLHKDDQFTNFEQQNTNQNENVGDINQHTQKELFTNFEQQSSNQNGENILSQNSQNEKPQTNFEQQINNQNEKIPNKWDQTLGFEAQSNIPLNPDVNQRFLTINTPINNHDINQNQYGWHIHENNENGDKNIDFYDNMKPASQGTDEGLINWQNHGVENSNYNLLQTNPSGNFEYNKFWNQNIEQESSFWHTNHNNNKFENSFFPNSFSTTDNENPLQGLWSKIDDISGEVTANNKFPHNSNFNSNNFNQETIENNSSSVNTNVNLMNHNSFEDNRERKQTSTTVSPILSSPKIPTSVVNINKPVHTPEPQPINMNQTPNSHDIGRGDIESEDIPLEIEIADKPNKTPQEIESLSLSKELQSQKEGDVQSAPSVMENKNVDKDVSNITNLGFDKKFNENRQYESSTVQLRTTPKTQINSEITTTSKSNVNYLHTTSQPSSIIGVIDLNSNPIPDLGKEKLHQQIAQKVEILDDTQQQQQNLEQQFEDFGQVQSSWFPRNNMQQGYDQINLEQQFEDFQQHENKPEKIYLEDFGQHIQSPLLSLKDEQKVEVAHGNPGQNHDSLIQIDSTNYESFQQYPISRNTNEDNLKNVEPLQVSQIEEVTYNKNQPENQKVENLNSEDVPPPPVATISEKPGFWKSIGNKLSTAKNKVYSWFSKN